LWESVFAGHWSLLVASDCWNLAVLAGIATCAEFWQTKAEI